MQYYHYSLYIIMCIIEKTIIVSVIDSIALAWPDYAKKNFNKTRSIRYAIYVGGAQTRSRALVTVS